MIDHDQKLINFKKSVELWKNSKHNADDLMAYSIAVWQATSLGNGLGWDGSKMYYPRNRR